MQTTHHLIPGTFIVAGLSYLVMLAGYFLHRKRYIHIPAMISVMLFDLSLPFYLYSHRHWWHRLIDKGEIFSSLVWMHVGILLMMYALYGAQIFTAMKIMKGDMEARTTHRSQGKVMLVVRLFVILTGILLAP
jgi:4-hydroxybenzoate polyprenyltransferase